MLRSFLRVAVAGILILLCAPSALPDIRKKYQLEQNKKQSEQDACNYMRWHATYVPKPTFWGGMFEEDLMRLYITAQNDVWLTKGTWDPSWCSRRKLGSFNPIQPLRRRQKPDDIESQFAYENGELVEYSYNSLREITRTIYIKTIPYSESVPKQKRLVEQRKMKKIESEKRLQQKIDSMENLFR